MKYSCAQVLKQLSSLHKRLKAWLSSLLFQYLIYLHTKEKILPQDMTKESKRGVSHVISICQNGRLSLTCHLLYYIRHDGRMRHLEITIPTLRVYLPSLAVKRYANFIWNNLKILVARIYCSPRKYLSAQKDFLSHCSEPKNNNCRVNRIQKIIAGSTSITNTKKKEISDRHTKIPTVPTLTYLTPREKLDITM